MIKVNLGDKEIEAESSWNEISLRRYFDIFEGLEEDTNVVHREATVISRILKVELKDILNLSIDEYNKLAEEFVWIYRLDELDSPDIESGLEIDGKQYKFLSKDKLSTAKYIDLDSIRNSDSLTKDKYDKWLTLLAVALEEGDKEDYKGYESRLELKSKLDRLPAVTILPYLNFFLKKSIRSTRIQYLSMMADTLMEQTNSAKNMLTSIQATDG